MGGDDWSLLEPEPMRRATRAKLKRARRLLEAHILAHKGFGLLRLGLLALHRWLFAEAPAAGAGPAARAGRHHRRRPQRRPRPRFLKAPRASARRRATAGARA